MVDEDDDGLYGLFVCEEYAEQAFAFKDVELTLLSSKMCTTDYDLTGQIVWPACRILSWFLTLHADLVEGKSVIELGAGCGLAGFVAANFARTVDITDGNDVVMRLLEKNKDHLGFNHVKTHKLMWGIRKDLIDLYPTGETPEVVIGADVILWPDQLLPLLRSLRWFLLLRDGTAKCYISYVHRANTTYALLEGLVSELGLLLEVIPSTTFVPSECEDLLRFDARILCISLQDCTLQRKGELMAESDNDIQQLNSTHTLPC